MPTLYRTIERDGRTLREYKVAREGLTETFQLEEGQESQASMKAKEAEKRLRVKEFSQNLHAEELGDHDFVDAWPCSRCQTVEKLSNDLCAQCVQDAESNPEPEENPEA